MKATRSFSIELGLVLVLLVGALVRFWGLDFGLPHDLARPDEQHYVGMALHLLNGTVTTSYFYEYPSLFFYLLAGGLGAYYVLGRLLGWFDGVGDLIYLYANDPAALHLVPRVMSAAAGVLTIFGVYKTVRRLLDSEKAALVGAFFMALCYLHVRDSHFGTMDVPMTCLIVASFHFVVKCWEEWSVKNYLLAGLLAGLAMSTKYAGVFMVFPMLALHFFKVREQGLSWMRVILGRRIWGFGVALVLGFLAGTPYFLTDYAKYWACITNRIDLLDTQGVRMSIGWWFHLKFSLWYGLGGGLYTAAFGGMLLYFVRDWRKAVVFVAFPLSYYLFVGKGYVVFLRYVVPVLPFMCIAATFFVFESYHFFKRRLSYRWAVGLSGVLILGLTLPSLENVIRFNGLIVKEDNREVGRKWVRANIEAGASIYQYTNRADFSRLHLRPTLDMLETAYENARAEGEKGRMQQARLKDWRLDTHAGFKAYNLDTLNRFGYNGGYVTDLPEYVLVHSYPILDFAPPNDFIQHLLDTRYRKIHEIQAVNPENKRNKYDQQDAFFLPFAGFEEVERMGNNIEIYRIQKE